MQASESFNFSNDKDAQLFSKLTHELRCSTCPNQNLAESYSETAKQLKNRLHRQIHLGKTENQIKEELVLHFGDVIFYNPPLRWSTSVLWGLPLALLCIGLFCFIKQFHVRNSLSFCSMGDKDCANQQ